MSSSSLTFSVVFIVTWLKNSRHIFLWKYDIHWGVTFDTNLPAIKNLTTLSQILYNHYCETEKIKSKNIVCKMTHQEVTKTDIRSQISHKFSTAYVTCYLVVDFLDNVKMKGHMPFFNTKLSIKTFKVAKNMWQEVHKWTTLHIHYNIMLTP